VNKLNLLSTKEMAAEFQKPVSTIQRWARMRLIPSISLGHRTRLFDPEAVRRALLKKTVKELN
jgi:DNA-binding transcriptional MerR regulator